MACQVCTEDFNKTSRKEVKCPKCAESFCSTCIKRYITETDCSCLLCKCVWDFEFLTSVLTKSFMKTEYRDIQMKKLFEKEFALLPETMYYVDLINSNKKLRERRKVLENEIVALRQIVGEIDTEIAANSSEIYGEKRKKYIPETNGPCPKENCRGFINRKNNTCGVCETEICKDCREVKTGNEHACKPENIESTKLIANDSKPCPKCAAFIFKIDGCDQMWCSNCQTAFSWKTGEIEKGRVHNPHYYDWLRTRASGDIPREPGDACDARYGIFDLERVLNLQKKKDADKIMNIHRKLIHINEVDIANLRYTIGLNSNNKALRIKYLMNQITKDEFQTTIEKRARLVKKMSAVLDCLSLFYDVMTDAFRNFSGSVSTVKDFFENYKNLSKFTNENIEKAELLYSCSFGRYKITYSLN